MQRLGMILYQIFKWLSLIALAVALYMTYHAPMIKIMAFMLFGMPAIILYVLARFFRWALVGPLPPRERRRPSRPAQ